MNGPVSEKGAPLAFVHPRKSETRAREHRTRAPVRLGPRPVSETPAGKGGERATLTVTLPAEPRLHGREASLVIGDAVAKLPVVAEQVAHLVYGVDDACRRSTRSRRALVPRSSSWMPFRTSMVTLVGSM